MKRSFRREGRAGPRTFGLLPAALMLGVCVAAGLGAGCVAPAGERPGSPGTAAADAPRVQPLGGTAGTVLSVQPAFRFGVVDFGLNPVPPVGTRLEVERNGAVVGHLRTGRDARGGVVVADLVDGEVATGDRVRVP